MDNESQQTYVPRIDKTDSEEIKLCEVVKHPFGIIVLYLQVSIGVIVGLILAYFLLPSVINDTNTAFLIANLFAGSTIILSILIMILSTVIYRQNRLVVTDRNVTQILQVGMFNRKISQLNMVNIEDVISVKNGLLSTIFGYGELRIETAGEHENFNFTKCPSPDYYAKIILNAREKILGQI